ncbi:MAG: hypothetical protein ACXADU_00360 [Promethearchaeota archaeon]|jgi:hypothetical protein
MNNTNIKNERKAIYFDLICGIVCSVISLSGIVFAGVTAEIYSIGWFVVGFTFWICYFLVSIIMVFVGLRGHFKIKKQGIIRSKKALRAPIA